MQDWTLRIPADSLGVCTDTVRLITSPAMMWKGCKTKAGKKQLASWGKKGNNSLEGVFVEQYLVRSTSQKDKEILCKP